MKRIAQLLVCVLAGVCAVPAMADGRGHGGWHGAGWHGAGGHVNRFNGGQQFGAHQGGVHQGGGFAYRHGGHGHRGGWSGNWVGPAVGAALLGGAIYAASTPSYAVQQQVLIAPQPLPAAPRVAYFCSTAQAYYPQVPTCQVPWQLVSY